MSLSDKLCGRMTGSPEEKDRREHLLAELLKAFERGGDEAVSGLLQAKMSELEGQFDERLAALEKRLQ